MQIFRLQTYNQTKGQKKISKCCRIKKSEASEEQKRWDLRFKTVDRTRKAYDRCSKCAEISRTDKIKAFTKETEK